MLIRSAKRGDEQAIIGLIRELAEYERAPDAVINTAEKLAVDLFEDEVCFAYVVENEESRVVGFALYYLSYSTWKGRSLYLEDFYVQPAARRGGIGQHLFDKIVARAKELKVRRMDWQVLEWNELALSFYRKQNAILDSEWVNGRLFFDFD
jgi:GNAT superfamily N-acetyltransferase